MSNVQPPSESDAPFQSLAAVIETGLQRLPEAERITVILADMHGRSDQEIARLMGVPRGTVRSRLSRARLCLRDYLLERQELLPAPYRFTSDRQEPKP